ncbi:MAG: hypothetical protein ATN36_03535 [Epulopiscium sp. Nele67-Bin005]|nr:MAG: hypothetical protein ATN36_03535 [Epulopiscium sp. Nele67-Bin005]
MGSNRGFVNMIIATGMIGVATLSGFVYLGLSHFTNDSSAKTIEPPKTETIDNSIISINSELLGVVQYKTEDELIVFDLQTGYTVRIELAPQTWIKDQKENPVPLDAIIPGEVVFIVYDKITEVASEVGVYFDRWLRTDVDGTYLNQNDQTLSFGEHSFFYNAGVTWINSIGDVMEEYVVGAKDKLLIRGIGNQIVTIQVIDEHGFLQLVDLPASTGRIEVNRNQQVKIEELGDEFKLPVTTGTHDIVLYIDGYEQLNYNNITIESGQTYPISAFDAKEELYQLVVQLGISDFTIKINDSEYKPTDIIHLPYGQYILEIEAEGYQPYSHSVSIVRDTVVRPVLQKEITPVEEEPEEEITEEGETTENNTEATTESGTNSSTSSNTTSSNSSTDVGHSINLNTTPEGAKIFVDGVYKGLTPASLTLDVGVYYVELEKDGYEKYSTSLIIDSEDSKRNYLYMLIAQPIAISPTVTQQPIIQAPEPTPEPEPIDQKLNQLLSQSQKLNQFKKTHHKRKHKKNNQNQMRAYQLLLLRFM